MAEDGSVVIDVKLNTAQADKELARMNAKIDKLSADLQQKSIRKGILSAALKEDYAQLDFVKDKVRELKAELSVARTTDQKDDIKERLADAVEEQKRLTASTTRMQNEYDKLNSQISEGEEKLHGMAETAGSLSRQIEKQRPFDEMASSIENAKSKLIKFVKYAVGIRTLYVLFRRLKNAIKEAVLQFASQDEETQTTINNLKASLATLKASWGAAFAPILNAVAPILQKLIGWLTAAANAVAQLFAVLGGRSTYKKAVSNNNALASSIDGVGEAAEKAQAQLMGFDELNVLNDDKSGGGGGGGAGGGSGFDVVEEEIAPWAQWVADHLRVIKDLAIAIGAALLTWKLANFIAHLMGVELGFKRLLGLALAVGGAVFYFAGWIDAFNNGVDWDNTLEMITGCTVAAIGLGLAFGSTAAAVALLVGGIGMLLVGVTDWIKKGELSTETFWLLEAAILAVGVAFALLLNPWSLLVAAFVAGALAIYKNWDSIKDWFNEKVKPWFTKEKWQELGRQAMQSIRNGLNSISLPKFHFYWETTGYTGSFFGRTFTVNIPFPHLDWYAKGGVFDGASVIGVGEAGKEAVVPLEKNTQWINLVVDGVIERLKSSGVADQLAAAFASIPTPVMAGGTIVPPNSVGSADSMGNIADALNEIRALLSGDGQNNTPEFRFYLDGKELHATVRKYDRQYSVAQGV